MSRISKVLRKTQTGLAFKCPGCGFMHVVNTGEVPWHPVWSYNGDPDKPTFQPSILVRTIRGQGLTEDDWEEYDRICSGQDGVEQVLNHPKFKWVCHSFVAAGRIQFLGDCSHQLAGQTVDLPELPELL